MDTPKRTEKKGKNSRKTVLFKTKQVRTNDPSTILKRSTKSYTSLLVERFKSACWSIVPVLSVQLCGRLFLLEETTTISAILESLIIKKINHL